MQPRMKNPAMVIPDAMQAILALDKSAKKGPVPPTTLELVHLRASQINGCSSCVDSGSRHAKKAGETDERLFAVAAWREAPYFTDAERAALALTEAVTRLSVSWLRCLGVRAGGVILDTTSSSPIRAAC